MHQELPVAELSILYFETYLKGKATTQTRGSFSPSELRMKFAPSFVLKKHYQQSFRKNMRTQLSLNFHSSQFDNAQKIVGASYILFFLKS